MAGDGGGEQVSLSHTHTPSLSLSLPLSFSHTLQQGGGAWLLMEWESKWSGEPAFSNPNPNP